MTVDRYLVRELLGPFLAGWFLLTVVFAAFVGAAMFADAAVGELSPAVLWRLILLRCVIGAEVLVPTAMFFAVLFVFERLNRDRELVAFLAGGYSRVRLLVPVVALGVALLALVAVLALQARPWAYRTAYLVEDIGTRPDIAAMRPGYFYPLGEDLVVTATGVDLDGGNLVDVFARQSRPGELRLIRAERARLSSADASGTQLVEFDSGQAITVYLPTEPDGAAPDGAAPAGDRRHRFEHLQYRWDPRPGAEQTLNRRAQSTRELMDSTRSKDVAELQWRFTLPLLTFGMMIVAGALGTLGPGRVTSLRMIGAIGAYVIVFNIAAAARTGVENGTLPPMPGIWWLPALPLLLIGAVLYGARRST
ncbi:MAG TPA: LptF/LptG family permease [Pseudomonadales bacterium]|nr:LptF/LptG family permease [Pseudomonadales bacterium]